MAQRALTRKQIAWAYDKWCLGYTQLQISEALNVCERTVRRALKNKDRIRPILVYKEWEETKNNKPKNLIESVAQWNKAIEKKGYID